MPEVTPTPRHWVADQQARPARAPVPLTVLVEVKTPLVNTDTTPLDVELKLVRPKAKHVVADVQSKA